MMIREYTNREVARILGEEEREPVYLHPYLQIRRGEVLLEARIGREKRYIVKNLLEFAQAVHSGKRVEYGKGMAFEHVPSAFAPESRPFLDLLLEEADAYIRHYEEMRGHAGLPLPVMRALTLGSAARDRLFDLLEGKEVQTEDEKGAERVKKYSTPMAAGLTYNYAAKQVDETVLDALAKLAASLAHMDSKKKGRALCEVFGAYGWAEGLKLMKWLLDHMLVNGINYFVPHAFSMKDFPDPDCPPHFYARGMNPQFPYFKNLMEYCNRVSHLISNGVHIPAVAVVYPAEQEWAGEYLPVEAIGKQLLRNQIDYEILPTDVLLTMTVVEGKLKWENEQVPVLILSGSRCITKMLADWLCKAAEKGLKIVVVGQKPLAMDNNGILREWTSQIKDNLTICEQEDLADILYSFGVDEIKTKKYEPWLRYYHYKHQNGEFWLFMNQSETEEINTSLCFEDGMMDSHKIDKECSCWYQAWENTVEPCEWDENNDLSLQLVPGEMKVLYMGDCTPYAKILAEKQEIMKLKKATDSQTGKIEIVPDAWKLWIKDTGTEKYVLQEREKTGDFCRKHPYFCGVMRYETTVFLPKIKSCELNLGEVYETAHVLVNEKEAGVRVALPYSFEIGKLLHEGENRIIVEVVNTLANRQRDFFSMTMPIEPSGLIGAVTLDYF